MSHFHFLNKVQPPQVTALDLGPNTACVLIKKRTVVIREEPMPILQPDGVLVKVISSGICGSDMHGYLAGGVGGRPMTEETVMGHEAAGEVVAVGEYVTTHKPGDRVASERLPISSLVCVESLSGVAAPLCAVADSSIHGVY
jgi:D-xylulose reductase